MVLYQVLQAWLSQLKSEEGQGMAEYGLILALVAIALIAAFVLLATGISGMLASVTTKLGGS